MKKISTKRWRLNVLVSYYDQLAVNHYQVDVLQVLQHLASIYKLDYAIYEAHQFSSDVDSSEQSADTGTVDLVYFRSNQYSRVLRKDFRLAIHCMFCKVPSLFDEGVEIDTQLYKALPEYPFPKDFYRPLQYPFVEYHQGRHITRYIYAADLLKVIEKEQDFPLN